MKLLGFGLLLSGWVIVIAALMVLAQDVARAAFVCAGLGVELVAMAVVIRAHAAPRAAED